MIKYYKCKCGWEGKRIAKPDLTCKECGELLEVDVMATVKTSKFERVEGAYEETKLTEYRRSKDGQLRESAYLAGDLESAY